MNVVPRTLTIFFKLFPCFYDSITFNPLGSIQWSLLVSWKRFSLCVLVLTQGSKVIDQTQFDSTAVHFENLTPLTAHLTYICHRGLCGFQLEKSSVYDLFILIKVLVCSENKWVDIVSAFSYFIYYFSAGLDILSVILAELRV